VTSNYIELNDGTEFNAVSVAGDLLTTASVAAFGFTENATPVFVAGSNAAIEIRGLNTEGSSVTFVGRDALAGAGGPLVEGVEINGTITSAGGDVVIGSVDSAGRAVPGSIDLDDLADSYNKCNFSGCPNLIR
jgi:phage baseplate assembly protein gpV